MNFVKIRKEQENYLLYFPSERKTIIVNEMGAKIVELFFNKRYSMNDTICAIAEEYNTENTRNFVEEIRKFLLEIKSQILNNSVNVAEQTKLDYPIGAEIEITTGCNLRCKHCFQGDYQEKFMPLEKFKHIVDILAQNYVYEINLVGGEIFYHKDIMSMLRYAASKGMAITIVTNATLITDEMIDQLSKVDYLYVLISLDGNKKIHNYIRGQGTYDRVVNTAAKVKKMGINTEFLFTLNSVNIMCYREVIELSKQLDIPINFNLFKPFDKLNHQELVISPELFFEAIEELLTLRVKKGYKIGLSNAAIVARALGLPDKNECTASLSGVVINTDGQMLICPYLVECGFHKKEDLPEFNENFIKIWNESELFKKFRTGNMRNCQACSYIYSGNTMGFDPYGVDAYIEYSKNRFDNQ